MSLAHALKTAIAVKEYNDSVEAANLKAKEAKDKSWKPETLVDGGTTWWVIERTKQVSGVTKVIKSKVRVVSIPYGMDDDEKYIGITKGKFSFTNGSGNRVYLSVKSYIEADKFVTEVYGKGMYRVSNYA